MDKINFCQNQRILDSTCYINVDSSDPDMVEVSSVDWAQYKEALSRPQPPPPPRPTPPLSTLHQTDPSEEMDFKNEIKLYSFATETSQVPTDFPSNLNEQYKHFKKNKLQNTQLTNTETLAQILSMNVTSIVDRKLSAKSQICEKFGKSTDIDYQNNWTYSKNNHSVNTRLTNIETLTKNSKINRSKYNVLSTEQQKLPANPQFHVSDELYCKKNQQDYGIQMNQVNSSAKPPATQRLSIEPSNTTKGTLPSNSIINILNKNTTLTVQEQVAIESQLYLHVGKPECFRRARCIQKIPIPPIPIDLAGQELGKEKQPTWKEYRKAMKPFKSREFANAKRTIQRLAKKDKDNLEDKDFNRLQRAQETVSVHKSMLVLKTAKRWVRLQDETFDIMTEKQNETINYLQKHDLPSWKKPSQRLQYF